MNLSMNVTPLTRRRLENFRANKRGYYSLWIFLAMFTVSLFSEFIANDKPIVMYHEGSLFFPVFVTYTEEQLGGEFKTEAKYEDPFVQQMVEASGGWMLWPPIRYSYDTVDWYIEQAAPAPPSAQHWLGTDDGARDVVARLLYGFRLSVSFGLALTLIASVIGITVGAVQGYYGGLVDLFGQRVIEIWAGLPMLFLLIILSSIVEPSALWLLLLLVLFSWMALVGVVRAANELPDHPLRPVRQPGRPATPTGQGHSGWLGKEQPRSPPGDVPFPDERAPLASAGPKAFRFCRADPDA